jgi:predicted phage terminase large subunit-like protein
MELVESLRNLPQEEFSRLLQNLQNDYDAFMEALIHRCATDIQLFAITFFPHYCRHAFNRFHRDTFAQYKFGERAIRRASAAPRGYAKSTNKVLIKPIHDVCYRLEKFIVIISNTDAQAVQKVKDIQSEFIGNDDLISAFGNFIPSRKIGSTDFVAHNADHPCRILALGSGTEMRGIRFGDVRPTKIILDDIEHSEEVESEMLREKQLNWYNDVISKIGDEQTNIELVGTVLHRESLLVKLINNPRYQSAEYRAIESWSQRKDLWDKWKGIYCNLDDGDRIINAKAYFMQNEAEMLKGTEVLWPEKEPYYALQEEIIETGIRSFMKEKQNSPMSDEEKVFAPENIWWYQEQEKGLFIEKTNTLIPWNMLTAYGTIDPSTGQRKVTSNKKPDFTSILSGYADQRNRLFVHEAYLKRVAPSVFIREIFDLHARLNYFKFGVETNLFRELLLDNILKERKRIEQELKKMIQIKFYEIYLTENKEKRIYSIEPKVAHGLILFNRNLSQEFMNQLYDFPKGTHDDGPDSLEMLWGLVNNKYKVGAL